MKVSDTDYISLKDATKYCNYSQDYLKLRARQGKLRAIKIGRNWVTTHKWIQYYLDGRVPIREEKTSCNSELPLVKVSEVSSSPIRAKLLLILIMLILISSVAAPFFYYYFLSSEHTAEYTIDVLKDEFGWLDFQAERAMVFLEVFNIEKIILVDKKGKKFNIKPQGYTHF